MVIIGFLQLVRYDSIIELFSITCKVYVISKGPAVLQICILGLCGYKCMVTHKKFSASLLTITKL